MMFMEDMKIGHMELVGIEKMSPLLVIQISHFQIIIAMEKIFLIPHKPIGLLFIWLKLEMKKFQVKILGEMNYHYFTLMQRMLFMAMLVEI